MERMYLSKVTLLLTLLVAVVAFLFGAYLRPFIAENANQSSLAKITDTASGRFSLVISPLVKSEKFLLDTQTGKIWLITSSGDQTAKNKVNLKLNNEKYSQSQIKESISKQKFLTEILPSDKVTVEVISNGKISKEKVPRANTLNEKLIDQTALRKNTLSAKTVTY